MTNQKKYDIKKQDVFNTIIIHLYEQYPFMPETIKRESNWYSDLCLTSWDRCEIYSWAEQEFAIKIPSHLTTVGALSDEIYKQISIKKPNNVKKTNLLQRIKQRFTQHTK